MKIHDSILDGLSQLAKDRHINILYACESGSRAWGSEWTPAATGKIRKLK